MNSEPSIDAIREETAKLRRCAERLTMYARTVHTRMMDLNSQLTVLEKTLYPKPGKGEEKGN